MSGRRLVGGEKLVFALLATALAMALTMAAFWGTFQYHGAPLTPAGFILVATGDSATAPEFAPHLTIGAALVAVPGLFLCWFGFGMGAKGQLKQIARAATKVQDHACACALGRIARLQQICDRPCS